MYSSKPFYSLLFSFSWITYLHFIFQQLMYLRYFIFLLLKTHTHTGTLFLTSFFIIFSAWVFLKNKYYYMKKTMDGKIISNVCKLFPYFLLSFHEQFLCVFIYCLEFQAFDSTDPLLLFLRLPSHWTSCSSYWKEKPNPNKAQKGRVQPELANNPSALGSSLCPL